MRYLAESLASIQRALSWPLISPDHAMILSMLRGPFLRAEREGRIEESLVELAIEGLEFLKSADPLTGALEQWCAKLNEIIPESVNRFLQEDPTVIEDWSYDGGRSLVRSGGRTSGQMYRLFGSDSLMRDLHNLLERFGGGYFGTTLPSTG
jgi:hypothetical protein